MSFSRFKGYKTKPKPGAMVDWTHALSRDIAGWWLFNEGSGNIALDISGNNNHGALTDMTPQSWAGSVSGGTLNFDGTQQGVLVNESNSLQFGTGDFSWVARIKRTGPCQSSSSKIIEKAVSGQVNRMQCRSNNRIEFQVHDSDGNLANAQSFPLELNTWHHIVGVKEGNTVRLYADGKFINDDTATFTGVVDDGDVRIGHSKDAGDRHFEGLIDDVVIYRHALSSFEVYQLYSNPFQNLLTPWTRRHNISTIVKDLIMPGILAFPR